MTNAEPYSPDEFFSPAFVIERFKRIVERHGLDKAIKDDRFKREREMWITAVFLLGLRNISPASYWVGPCLDKTTPDTYGVSFTDKEKGLNLNIQNIEVFEWESHGGESLIEAFASKLKGKHYPKYFTLLCYAHSRTGQIEFEPVFQYFQKNIPGIGAVWFVSSVAGKEPGGHVLVQLFPERAELEFNYLSELKVVGDQLEIIKVLGRGTDKKFSRLGTKFIPLP